MNDDWTINTLIGLGQIRFGIPPANIAAFSAIYGVVAAQTNKHAVAKVTARSRALFGKYFSEEDIAAGEEYAAGLSAGPDELTQTLAGSKLVLDYSENELHTITASPAAALCNFQNELVFDLPPIQLIELLEMANGAPGRYDSTGAAFDMIAVYLEGFTVFSRHGSLRPMRETDERFLERTIMLRTAPYAVTEFLPEGRSYSVARAPKTP